MIKLACFDLDGTLIFGTSTTLFLAEKLGFLNETIKYEEDYRLGVINNIQGANLTAHQLRGVTIEKICEIYELIPKIGNINPTIISLKKRDIVVILASITWSFFVEIFAKNYGFHEYCGTKMKICNNTITGEIEAYCTEKDKLRFFLDVCRNYDIPLADTVAIGDSKSDHPIFRRAGISIALNADMETKKLAKHSIDTNDLLDILPLFE